MTEYIIFNDCIVHNTIMNIIGADNEENEKVGKVSNFFDRMTDFTEDDFLNRTNTKKKVRKYLSQ